MRTTLAMFVVNRRSRAMYEVYIAPREGPRKRFVTTGDGMSLIYVRWMPLSTNSGRRRALGVAARVTGTLDLAIGQRGGS